jgi:hypothetical protein
MAFTGPANALPEHPVAPLQIFLYPWEFGCQFNTALPHGHKCSSHCCEVQVQIGDEIQIAEGNLGEETRWRAAAVQEDTPLPAGDHARILDFLLLL